MSSLASAFRTCDFAFTKTTEVGGDELFDYVLITDINDQVDPIAALRALRSAMHNETRIIIDNYNHLWEPIIRFAERFRLKYRRPLQNWLSTDDLQNIMTLCDLEPLQVHRTVLLPKKIPLLSGLANRFLARLPGLRRLNLTHLLVARPLPRRLPVQDYSVSIIVPCRNEVGNIAAAVERIPNLGRSTEIIFCDDKSTDGTAEEVRRVQQLHPERDIKLYEGPGICKARNVHTGFDRAEGDILMILDADLTTMPEELHYFYDVIACGKGGVRERLPVHIPHGRRRDGALEYRRQPLFQRPRFAADRATDQRHVVRHQGIVAPALAGDSRSGRHLGNK